MHDLNREDFTPARVVRADLYFEEHLNNQRAWYGRKSSTYSKWAHSLSFTVILAGGLTAFLQIFRSGELTFGVPDWPVIATALLALLIVVAEGLARIGRFNETWAAYRKASEQMKREYRLYINGAGGYEQFVDEEAAYRAFVANVELIIAEEQQLYWRTMRQESGAPPNGKESDGP